MSLMQNLELKKNRYKIISRIGVGVYGEVWKIEDRKEKNIKAMKCVELIDPHTGDVDQTANDEIRILNDLCGTPGVVQLYDYFSFRHFQCLVLPLYCGDLHTLRHRNLNKSFSDETVIKVAYELTQVLESIHRRGYLHRDIKCANVMMRHTPEHNSLVLIDFGLAVKFSHTNGRRLKAGLGDFMFSGCSYAPPRLQRGLQAQETEDLMMLCYLLLTLKDFWPFTGKTSKKILEQKEAFEKQPQKVLKSSLIFLLPIIRSISGQEYGAAPNYNEVLQSICRSMPNFNPLAPFKLSKNDRDEWILA